MTIRKFCSIFVKVLGIALMFGMVTVLSHFLLVLFSGNFNNYTQVVVEIASFLLSLGICGFILRQFFSKNSWFIDKLQLDEDVLEKKIELINHATVLTIASIILGGILFVDNMPDASAQIFDFFIQKNFIMEGEIFWRFIFGLAKIIIGYLLMTQSQFVVDFIEKQKTK